MVLKLDFAKAFDSINWASLRAVMEARGFPSLWCDWMDALFHSSSSAVLLNGVPGRWFRVRCGLRQGNPISPYLFLIVADVLQRLIRRMACCITPSSLTRLQWCCSTPMTR